MIGSKPARQLTARMVLVVTLLTIVAWYVTWTTADPLMSLMMMPSALTGPIELGLFFVLITVMMVAMMLPAALPMIMTFHGRTRMNDSHIDGSKDVTATVAFVTPYFLLWGGFGVVSLFGLTMLGVMGPLTGPIAIIPAATLFAAGTYQITRVKQMCLSHCQSPLSFVMHHWRGGRMGAMRMGLSHALYCLGCCWLFMIALFVAGSMSLLWMGALSAVIFVEKVGFKQLLFSRVFGAMLVLLGGVAVAQFFLTS